MRTVPFRLAPRHHRLATRVMQAAIAGILAVGVLRANANVAVNATLALLVTFLPAALERDHDIVLPSGVTLWIALAVLLHAAGMLGPYRDVWWWDHVTHTLSAAIVAGVGYAVTLAVDRHVEAIYLPPRVLAAFVLLVTMAAGVAWEIVEFATRAVADRYGYGPVLIQYGLGDTVVDLVFDLAGAVVVTVLGGARGFTGLADAIQDRLRSLEGPRFR